MFPLKEADTIVRALISGIEVFDRYRFVDPKDDSEFRNIAGLVCPTEKKCYEIWGRDTPCKNCTSKRAMAENEQMIKLEFLNGQIILILSTPVSLGGRSYVLEMAKTVTDSLLFGSKVEGNNRDIETLIHDFNEIAVRDPFTKLYNKPFSEQELARNVQVLRGNGGSLIAAMLDIDSFKKVNDTYGHQCGDEVIKTIARYIAQATSWEGSWAGRIGGDEFLLVFRGGTKQQAHEACAALEKQIAEHEFEKDGKVFHTSVSIGMREFSPQEDVPAFMNILDKEMYKAKRGL